MRTSGYTVLSDKKVLLKLPGSPLGHVLIQESFLEQTKTTNRREKNEGWYAYKIPYLGKEIVLEV
jgi:purine-nucleoside phosphorylase